MKIQCILILFSLISCTYAQENKYGFNIEIQKMDSLNIPDSTKFLKQGPNPFSPVTGFVMAVEETSLIKVELYDNMMNYLNLIVYNEFKPGKYSVIFDGTSLKSGVYFLRLESDNSVDFMKYLLVK